MNEAGVDEAARRGSDGRSVPRGRLKIFLGMCAGVGKTYAMLEAARVRALEGVDVVVGVVETHGRADTARLVEGREVLPLRTIRHRNIVLGEFDIDACIERRPGLVLLDELAHSNAPGSRHLKRWQDADELLGRGISVYTTLNVQHIESLNDVVARVTGVVVAETVPDTVVDQADEIELVDLNPEELTKRLEDGRIYGAERAGAASANFLKPSNLVALREIALRYVAERVDRQVLAVRDDRRASRDGAPSVWPVRERLLVCVTASPSSARLVRGTRRLASRLGAEWFAVHVDTRPESLSPADRERLHRIFKLAEQLGGRTATIPGTRIAPALLGFARAQNVTKIVLGKTKRSAWARLWGGTLAQALEAETGEIDLYVLGGEGPPIAEAGTPRRPSDRCSDIVVAVAAVGLCTLGCYGLHRRLAVSEINIAMIFLAVGAFIGLRGKRLASVLAAVLSVAAFDFFFVDPYLSFAVSDARYLPTFGVMLMVALLTGELTVRIRRQELAARRREARTALLYDLTRDLADAPDAEALTAAAVKHTTGAFGARVAVWRSAPGSVIDQGAGDSGLVGDPRERAAAMWVFETRTRAGPTTGTLPALAAIHLPLVAGGAVLGVLAVAPADLVRFEDPEERSLLDAMTGQIAQAFERARLTAETAGARVLVETERLRAALLSSVSHDFRTPLASILGASTTLLEQGDALSPDERREILGAVRDESERLTRLVRNLLDMTRLESGALAVKREWQHLEEAIESALRRTERALRGREVSVRLPDDLPLVPIDGVLIEQVFINLLENAAAYTPPGSPIDIAARALPGAVAVEVGDRGPGVPLEQRDAIFRPFQRGGRKEGAGVGLGLAIADGIVRAHGAKMSVLARPGGGALFAFELPIVGAVPTIASESPEAASP